MNDGLHQQPLRVDENMTLLALDLLSRIEPVRIDRGPPFFRASHALAVDDGGGWAGLAFGLLTTLFVEHVMDAIQHAINAPIAEVSIDGAARRQILGKVTPLASRAQHVHDGVERLSHVCFAPAASPPRRRNERFDMRPLLIRQVARVSQMIPLVFRSVLVRPHGGPKSVRLLWNHNQFMGLNNFRARH